jgi:hypothetical protein
LLCEFFLFAEGNVAPVVSAIATVTVPAAQESVDAADKSCLYLLLLPRPCCLVL